MMKGTAIALLALAALAGSAAASGVPGEPDCTVAEFLASRPEDFSTTLQLVGVAASKSTDNFYSGASNSSIAFTFFAPNNQAWENAFNALGASIDTASRSENLDPVLRYHVVGGLNPLAADIPYGTVLNTFHPALPGYFDSNNITSELLVFGPYVAGTIQDVPFPVSVVEADIQCGEGIIHVIDNLLVPDIPDPEEDFFCNPAIFLNSGYIPGVEISTAILNQDFSYFSDYYIEANSTAEYTFFVPTDAAWMDAMATYNFTLDDILNITDIDDLQAVNNVLFYHFVGGSTIDYETFSGFTGELVTGTFFTPWYAGARAIGRHGERRGRG